MMISVSKQEFDLLLIEYKNITGNKIIRDYCQISEPAIYNFYTDKSHILIAQIVDDEYYHKVTFFVHESVFSIVKNSYAPKVIYVNPKTKTPKRKRKGTLENPYGTLGEAINSLSDTDNSHTYCVIEPGEINNDVIMKKNILL